VLKIKAVLVDVHPAPVPGLLMSIMNSGVGAAYAWFSLGPSETMFAAATVVSITKSASNTYKAAGCLRGNLLLLTSLSLYAFIGKHSLQFVFEKDPLENNPRENPPENTD
jgi:hypothetical protein